MPGETTEQLDRIGEKDRRRAEQGLVALLGAGGSISYKHVDELGRLDMNARTAAERVERRKQGGDAPPIPEHLLG